MRLGVSIVLKHGQSVKWCNFPTDQRKEISVCGKNKNIKKEMTGAELDNSQWLNLATDPP